MEWKTGYDHVVVLWRQMMIYGSWKYLCFEGLGSKCWMLFLYFTDFTKILNSFMANQSNRM
jgi:hypothetical protein